MTSPAPAESTSLSNRVADYVLTYIRTQKLKSGDKVPSELRVSAGLKISRGIVREAYRSLSAAGIIEVAPGRSPKVGALNNSLLTHMIRHGISTRQVSPEQVLELRSAIEARAAELASKRRTAEDLEQLRESVAGMGRSISDADQFVRHDLVFHQVISGAGGNPLFHLIGGALRGCMEQSMRAGLQSRTNRDQMARIVDSHSVIVDAIEAADADRAGQLMKVHFDEARAALRGAFD
jgi:DNA-binding FadR family transcriptional regulator